MLLFRVILSLSIIMLAAGCNSTTEKGDGRKDPEADETSFYAKRFSLEKQEGYTKLTINNPWQGAMNISHTYYLVQRDKTPPEGVELEAIIYVPVKRIISMSTTYLPMITALGEERSIVGISGSDLLFNESLRECVKRGEVADVGYEDNLNKELAIKLSPDIIMVYGVGGEASGYLNKLHDLGISVLFNADYLEDDPLGKAEWIKVFGALYNKEEEAEKIFRHIRDEYLQIIKELSEKISYRPKVLLGLPWKDTWFISPGNSFVSKLIADAGGIYLWNDTKSETSMPYGVENVWMKAMEADFWLNISTASRHEEIINVDYRLGDLPSYRKGNLYNNNKRVAGNGGNDYWESGSVNPHIILKDIASILHPGIFPGYELYYYQKVK